MTLETKIEAVLFTAARTYTLRRLAELCEVEVSAIKTAASNLQKRLDEQESALQLTIHGQELELVTRPAVASIVQAALKEETQGELTRPSLEALAILAYRGPLTRPELEQIRGVQSALILRNLMLRGLVEMHEDVRLGQPTYQVTLDFLKVLGMKGVQDLPDFEALHATRAVEQVLEELSEAPKAPDQKVEI